MPTYKFSFSQFIPCVKVQLWCYIRTIDFDIGGFTTYVELF